MRSRGAKRRGGQSLIEFVMSTTLAVPVILLFVDAFVVLHGIELNNSTCFEAARLASSGDPRLTVARASQIVAGKLAAASGPYSLELRAARTTVTQSQLDSMQPYGGQLSGSVKVTTQIEVKSLFLGWFLGGQPVHFVSTQEFPTTYVVPNFWQPCS